MLLMNTECLKRRTDLEVTTSGCWLEPQASNLLSLPLTNYSLQDCIRYNGSQCLVFIPGYLSQDKERPMPQPHRI